MNKNNTLEEMCRYTDEVVSAIFKNSKNLIMKKEQQDKLWLELSEESRKRIINDYLDLLSDNGRWINDYTEEERSGAIAQIEWTFGTHNLNPKLTYEDVAKELFGGKDVAFINSDGDIDGFRCVILNSASNPNVCTSSKQSEKLLAINKLLNVAKYLNGDWVPNWSNGDEPKYSFCYDGADNCLKIQDKYNWCHSFVYFRTEELAEQAVQILGEETIITALSTDY